ncbi:repressor of the inhibitor of the protein kinase [Chionoecetes opilio]|uniref:Repressor of the inhibitor of the protein kinase n=1 Tax=Chionoecetes opilio TaxID=41210 RepID=A0A8J8WEA7_CHIOP|nr:repressor of the inhibitor of the protein kinase [Chionoecetes opilio]
MPNICAVLGCTAHFRQRETNLGLHRIPKDPGLRKKWIQACGAIGVNQNARVCSLHFKTTDYEKITRRYDLLQIPVPKSLRQLKASVVPTLLLPTIQGNGVELDVSTSAAPPLSHVEVKG